MSNEWTAQDEAQLEEMMRRRKASFEVLSGAVWSGVAPHVANHDEAEKLTNAVVDVLLREGRQVGPLFRMFDPTNNGEADGWKRVIMTEELYDRTTAYSKKVGDGMTWEQALKGAVIVAAMLQDFFTNGATFCTVKPGGIVTPNYPGVRASDTDSELTAVQFSPTKEEAEALRAWGQKKRLSIGGILRQALRLYDSVERALEDPSVGAVKVAYNGLTAIPKDAP
jgi:hypothetical protein